MSTTFGWLFVWFKSGKSANKNNYECKEQTIGFLQHVTKYEFLYHFNQIIQNWNIAMYKSRKTIGIAIYYFKYFTRTIQTLVVCIVHFKIQRNTDRKTICYNLVISCLICQLLELLWISAGFIALYFISKASLWYFYSLETTNNDAEFKKRRAYHIMTKQNY